MVISWTIVYKRSFIVLVSQSSWELLLDELGSQMFTPKSTRNG